MSTGAKLAVGAGVLVGVTAYMAYLGASDDWQYYLTADECLASSQELAGHRLRVSGKIALDSLAIQPDRSAAEFLLAGKEQNLPVICRGPLPDNLAEEIDVVVEGRLEESGLLFGDKVLTKCASKYAAEKAQAESKHTPAAGPEKGT